MISLPSCEGRFSGLISHSCLAAGTPAASLPAPYVLLTLDCRRLPPLASVGLFNQPAAIQPHVGTALHACSALPGYCTVGGAVSGLTLLLDSRLLVLYTGCRARSPAGLSCTVC